MYYHKFSETQDEILVIEFLLPKFPLFLRAIMQILRNKVKMNYFKFIIIYHTIS